MSSFDGLKINCIEPSLPKKRASRCDTLWCCHSSVLSGRRTGYIDAVFYSQRLFRWRHTSSSREQRGITARRSTSPVASSARGPISKLTRWDASGAAYRQWRAIAEHRLFFLFWAKRFDLWPEDALVKTKALSLIGFLPSSRACGIRHVAGADGTALPNSVPCRAFNRTAIKAFRRYGQNDGVLRGNRMVLR